MPRIALIHATVLSMDPTETAFSDLWPEAETFHLLDSSLSTDRAKAGELTDNLSKRIVGMAEYAAERGVDGVLYCCSAFGQAIEYSRGGSLRSRRTKSAPASPSIG